MHPTVLALAAVSLLALSAAAPGAAAAASSPIHVRFLFDLGDGTYDWANATIPDPMATNATWNAMQAAAAGAGLWISWSWYSGSFGSGVFITDLGNRSPPTVALFVWDPANTSWAPATVGVTDLVLADNASIALADTDYNPVTYNPYPPAATPGHPFPAAEFRYDLRNSGASPAPSPDGLRVLWAQAVVPQEIESAPVVVGGLVYVVTMDGTFALQEDTGTIAWSNIHVGGLSTPAFYNGTLLVDGTDGRVHALSAANGTEAWNVTLLARTSFSGITSSPKLLFDTAYLGTFNESGGAGQVVALGAVNGTVLWRHTAPASVSFSSPAVADGILYVGIIGRYNTTTQVTYDPPYGVLALDAATGTQRWFHALNASVAASPVVADGSVFVPAKDGNVYALDPTTGAVRWQVAAQAGVSSPAYHAGTLYVGGGSSSFGGGGRVAALNATTGAAEWSFTPNGIVQSSVTYAGGEVLFSTNVANGTIYALDAEDGSLLWSYAPSPAQYIFGSPVVADGTVFAPSDNGRVYAIGSPQPLVSLNVTLPSSFEVGENVTVTVRVGATGGRMANGSLTMALRGLDVRSADAAYVSPSPDIYVFELGPIPFLANRTITIEGVGACIAVPAGGCLLGTQNGGANVVDYGGTGLRHQDATLYFGLNLGSPAPPSSPPLWLYAVVPAIALVAVLGVVVYVVRRRRRAGGP